MECRLWILGKDCAEGRASALLGGLFGIRGLKDLRDVRDVRDLRDLKDFRTKLGNMGLWEGLRRRASERSFGRIIRR